MKMANTEQLEAFVNVVQEGSFSKAAEKLHLTQPAVSAQIRSLENELGTKLFDRSFRKITLTEDGTTFYARTKEIFFKIESAVKEVRDSATGPGTVMGSKSAPGLRHTLQIAVSSTPSEFLLPEILEAYQHRNPEVCVSVSCSVSEEAIRRVAALECDLGIAGFKYPKTGCEYYPLLSDELLLATPDKEPFSSMGKFFDEKLLLNYPIILRYPGSGVREQYEDYLASRNMTSRKKQVFYELDNTEAVLRAIRSGLGVGLISSLVLRWGKEREGVKLFSLQCPLLWRHFWLVWRRTKRTTAEVEDFLWFARELAEKTKASLSIDGL